MSLSCYKYEKCSQVVFNGRIYNVYKNMRSHEYRIRTTIDNKELTCVVVPDIRYLDALSINIDHNMIIVSFEKRKIDYKSSWLENCSYFNVTSPKYSDSNLLQFQCTVLFYIEQRILYNDNVLLYYTNNYSYLPKLCQVTTTKDYIIVHFSMPDTI